MYKKQMKMQKIVCLLALIAGALVFIYALGLATDLYDSLYYTMTNPNNLLDTKVAGSIIYYDIQGFNHNLLIAGIGLIVVSCGLYLTNTHVRRRYYVGNFVSTILMCAANIGVTLWAHAQIDAFRAQYLQVDFAALERYKKGAYYIESTFWFDVQYFVFAIVLIVTLLLLVNLIWKLWMMAAEKKLLTTGKSVRTAGEKQASAVKAESLVNEEMIKKDRMRFVKNKLPANLALLAILLNVIYFVIIYKSDVQKWYYQMLIGGSIVYNLVFMLAAFLSSEGIKSYKQKFAWLLGALGIGQIVRIFILPMQAHEAVVKRVQIMGDAQFITVVVLLALSAACCIAAAVIGYLRCRTLSNYQKQLETA